MKNGPQEYLRTLQDSIMRALSIRQPYAELILRGIKTAEHRTRPTRIGGQRLTRRSMR